MSSFNPGSPGSSIRVRKVVATLRPKRGIVQTAYTFLAAEQRGDLLKIVRGPMRVAHAAYFVEQNREVRSAVPG
jgi:hypothetical protein